MSAVEILREAARLMRARAEALKAERWAHLYGSIVADQGTCTCGPDDWGHHERGCGFEQLIGVPDALGPHIAGMDPTVAIAVADWLADFAVQIQVNVDQGARKPGCHPNHPALNVARTYLRSES